MVSGSLALLLFIDLDLPLGSRAAALIGEEVLYNGEIGLAGLAGPQAWLAGPQAWLDGPEGGTDVRTDGRMDGRTDGRKISPFYRTSSPIGAAALLPKGRSTPIKRSRARVSLTT